MSESKSIADLVNQVKAELENARIEEQETRRAAEEEHARQETLRPAHLKRLLDMLFPCHTFELPTSRQTLKGVHQHLPGIWFAQGTLPEIPERHLYLILKDDLPSSLEVYVRALPDPKFLGHVWDHEDVKKLVKSILEL